MQLRSLPCKLVLAIQHCLCLVNFSTIIESNPSVQNETRSCTMLGCLLTCQSCSYCRAELQQTGEELLSAFSQANGALEYIPPVNVNGITLKSVAAKTQGILDLACMISALHSGAVHVMCAHLCCQRCKVPLRMACLHLRCMQHAFSMAELL